MKEAISDGLRVRTLDQPRDRAHCQTRGTNNRQTRVLALYPCTQGQGIPIKAGGHGLKAEFRYSAPGNLHQMVEQQGRQIGSMHNQARISLIGSGIFAIIMDPVRVERERAVPEQHHRIDMHDARIGRRELRLY